MGGDRPDFEPEGCRHGWIGARWAGRLVCLLVLVATLLGSLLPQVAAAGTPPTVVTTAASSVRERSTTLNATVNPTGGEVSECEFEYGTTTSYGSSAPCESSPGSGGTPVAVSAVIHGLIPNASYHFRISATNPSGTSKGSDETSPSPPTVVTGSASGVTSGSATLSATVNPNECNGRPGCGKVSECKFEYGTTTSYGSSAPCPFLPRETSPVAESVLVRALAANTTYHFRISATSPAGTSKGSDQTFTTLRASHYFSGGLGPTARIAPGEKLPTISWGTLSLTNRTTGLSVTCRTVIGGYVENPAPGGPTGPAGVGETQSFSPYECESPACTPTATKSGPATYISLRAEPAGAPFPSTGSATNLRWRSELVTEGSLIRPESVGIKLNVACHLNTGLNGKGEPEFAALTPEGYEGAFEPRFIVKCCRANAPAETEFDAGAGALRGPPFGEPAGTLAGTVKLVGYNEQEAVNAQLE